jgi:hypothetical protein
MSQSSSMSVYLALSIANTNCFITAARSDVHRTKTPQVGDILTIGSHQFSIARASDISVKLHAPELEAPSGYAHNGNTKAAVKDAKRIYEYFHALRGEGWTVKDDAFIKRHKLKSIAATPAPTPPAGFAEGTVAAGPVVLAAANSTDAANSTAADTQPVAASTSTVQTAATKLSPAQQIMVDVMTDLMRDKANTLPMNVEVLFAAIKNVHPSKTKYAMMQTFGGRVMDKFFVVSFGDIRDFYPKGDAPKPPATSKFPG